MRVRSSYASLHLTEASITADDVVDLLSLDLSGFFALYEPVEPDRRSEPNRRQGDLCIQPCMGGTAQTRHMIVHPRHIKTRALYVYGSHQVNIDGTTHTRPTDAMWEVYVKASD